MFINTCNEAESCTDTEGGTREDGTARYTKRCRLARCFLALLVVVGAVITGCASTQSPASASTYNPNPGNLFFASDSGAAAVVTPPPAGSSIELGRSVNGIPLTMEVFGNGPDTILIVGGIHGDEPTGAIVASNLARLLRAHPEFLIGHTVGILAQANPDGLLSGTRTNANGVDLNRNFPSRDWRRAYAGTMLHGSVAASEPETLAVMNAIEIVKPLRIVDIHSIGSDYHCNNYDGPAEHLAELMSAFNGYPVLSDIGYPTPGALGCWAGIDLDVPAITLELPREHSGEKCCRDNITALLAFISAGDTRFDR